ncbi:MAG: SH3 domain-containing protein [Rhodomicrobium sp.]
MRKIFPVAFFLLTASAAAQAGCVVTDPTGTPLNIRTAPNGEIIGTLRNGAAVTIQSTAYDSRGRLWANIGIGWVFREFISCY